MHDMLVGGAKWAVEHDWGTAADLERIEEHGQMLHAKPANVSDMAKKRQREEMGTLGSGNHYLEVQEVTEIHDASIAEVYGLKRGDIVVMIHCGSRGLGHQIGTDYLRMMVEAAPAHGLTLPDRELACAPLRSELGQQYLGAMRAAINCALANRQILTHLVRQVFARIVAEGADCRCSTTSRTTPARSSSTAWTASCASCSCTARARHAPSARATPTCPSPCAPPASRC